MYLDSCELGPYRATDVGDGSCQMHLNTKDCYYDGGMTRNNLGVPCVCTRIWSAWRERAIDL